MRCRRPSAGPKHKSPTGSKDSPDHRFFCAGTPSTKGTLELLKSHGIDPNSITDFRYRGIGWPGMATAHFKDQAKPPFKLTYQESWGFVNRYRPFRCYLCPDLTAEAADISVGDPWYREVGEHEPGRSLILIRTEQGKREAMSDELEEENSEQKAVSRGL